MSFAAQQQEVPGVQAQMDPFPDCGKNSYRGSQAVAARGGTIGQTDQFYWPAATLARHLRRQEPPVLYEPR